jgi:hypothetical protein
MVAMVTKGVLVTVLINSITVTTATPVTKLRGASFRTDPEKTLLMFARTSPPSVVSRVISYLEKRYTICDGTAVSCQVKVCLAQFAILNFCLGKTVTEAFEMMKVAFEERTMGRAQVFE